MFQIVMQFHGINNKSLTIRRTVRKIKLSNEEWKTMVDLVNRALQFIHSKGVLHNDLKGDNILLKRRQNYYNQVVIDFRKKHVYWQNIRGKKAYVHQRAERVHGKISACGTGASIASDTYSFAKVIDFLCDKAGLNLCSAKRVFSEQTLQSGQLLKNLIERQQLEIGDLL